MGCSGKESTCRCRRCKRCGFDPWVGKILWRRKWKLQMSCFLEFSGIKYMCVYTHMHTHTHTHTYVYTCMCCAVLRLSVLSDAVILWTVARQAPLSMRILQAIILEWVAMTSSRGTFPIQGLNPGLPHCRQILYHLNHQGSPRILEWVVYPFSRGSSQPMNQTGVSCLAGGFFTS